MEEEEVKNLAYLSRLSIKDEEVKTFQKQLDSIVSYIKQVKDFSEDSEIIEMNLVVNHTRNDDYKDINQDSFPDLILNEAPESSDRYFKVPKVIDKNSEA